MKALMKQVGGNGRGHKKARVWNMAQFQPRRWRREQAQAAAASPEPLIQESIDPSIQPDPLPLIHESTNPPIQSSTPSNPPTQPIAPPPAPEPTKEKDELKNSFIALRGQGWSFRSISKKLGVPKSTLFNWESDTANRRAIKVIKSIHVERLQEQHLPSFEDELVKLSTFLARIERALEKHDFDSMRPEFLLRTSLQLRARLQKLRINTHPTDTLDDGDVPEINCGRIFRSEEIPDDSDGSRARAASAAEDKPQGSHARAASVVQDEPSSVASPQSEPPSDSSLKSVVNSSSVCGPETETWDTYKNSELSQPSLSATSAAGVGTPVPLSQPPASVVPDPAGSLPPTNHDGHIVLTAGFGSPGSNTIGHSAKPIETSVTSGKHRSYQSSPCHSGNRSR
jgi:hypothetical protein